MHEPAARLEGAIRNYAWGSRTTLARLQGRAAPTSEPEAELWLGAHPLAPATLCRADGSRTPLDVAVGEAPVHMLGEPVVHSYGPTLPFLLKVLAVESPLSLQVHPDSGQARVGFEAEEAAQVPRDAPHRVFRDCWGKPELLCALSRMQVLCGLRPVEEAVAVLRALEVSALAPLATQLATQGAAALGSVVRRLLTWPDTQRAQLVAAVAAGAERLCGQGGRFAASAGWVRRLADEHPRDPGVVVALLLHLVDLAPGDAVDVPPGTPHAYLRGTGIEVMASSDNVIRGGLTAKHVDVDRLLAVLDPRPGPPPVLAAEQADGWQHYPSATQAFCLSRLTVGQRIDLDGGTPQVLLTVDGRIEVHAPAPRREAERTAPVALGPGQAAFVPAGTSSLALHGAGTAFRATPPAQPAATRTPATR